MLLLLVPKAGSAQGAHAPIVNAVLNYIVYILKFIPINTFLHPVKSTSRLIAHVWEH